MLQRKKQGADPAHEITPRFMGGPPSQMLVQTGRRLPGRQPENVSRLINSATY
jgi:hypothetical protein